MQNLWFRSALRTCSQVSRHLSLGLWSSLFPYRKQIRRKVECIHQVGGRLYPLATETRQGRKTLSGHLYWLSLSLSLYRNANVLILCIFQLYQSALSAVCSIWNLARCIPLLSYLEGDSLKHFNTEAEINPTVFENVSSIACSVHPMCILDNQTIQHECFKVLRRNHFQRCRPEA